ncbi:hypothetical protein CHS0354_038493 [Potamilus streckersoni]|uniref:Uncharacterized protein n=1 Tax=Potamilus streckersoni TaxID=2493646 RepID=A0AAE0S5V5_9BIVA|nr:hypothetical protein CHS0354_038493 [Potamilus streckersoni]
MGKHAKLNYLHVPFKDLKIHCPNCRLPLSVQQLMSRNVTFNYPLASLLEALRASTVTEKESKSTSTEEDSEEYRYDAAKLDKIREDIDRVFATYRLNNNVIDDSRREIDKLREELSNFWTGSQFSNMPNGPPECLFGCEMGFDYSLLYQTGGPLNFGHEKSKVSTGKSNPPPGLTAPPPGFENQQKLKIEYEDPAIMSCGTSIPSTSVIQHLKTPLPAWDKSDCGKWPVIATSRL